MTLNSVPQTLCNCRLPPALHIGQWASNSTSSINEFNMGDQWLSLPIPVDQHWPPDWWLTTTVLEGCLWIVHDEWCFIVVCFGLFLFPDFQLGIGITFMMKHLKIKFIYSIITFGFWTTPGVMQGFLLLCAQRSHPAELQEPYESWNWTWDGRMQGKHPTLCVSPDPI